MSTPVKAFASKNKSHWRLYSTLGTSEALFLTERYAWSRSISELTELASSSYRGFTDSWISWNRHLMVSLGLVVQVSALA